jgi:flagellar protein FlgJ
MQKQYRRQMKCWGRQIIYGDKGLYKLRIETGAYQLIDKKAELKNACLQFESLFVGYLLKAMKNSIPKSGFLDQGFAFQMAQSMYDEALSEQLAKTGAFGVAERLYDQLSSYMSD